MFCPNCGYENDDDSLFCEKCGAAMNNHPNQPNQTMNTGGSTKKHDAQNKVSPIAETLPLIATIIFVSVFIIGFLSFLGLVRFSVLGIILVIVAISIVVVILKKTTMK